MSRTFRFAPPLGRINRPRARVLKCRVCEAPIAFIRSATSTKKIPVNAEAAIWVRAGETADGKKPETVVTDEGRVVRGELVAESGDHTGCVRGQRAHFASCLTFKGSQR